MNAVRDFILLFTSILYEAMPFIVLGAVIAGILEELVPQRLVLRLIPQNRALAITIGGGLGLLFPMCECGIITVMRRLLRKGVPLSCCVCYMLSGPIINGVVMLSTYVAFQGRENDTDSSGRLLYQMGGGTMMGLRVGLGFLTAVVTGLIVEWQYRKHGDKLLVPVMRFGAARNENENETGPARPWKERVGAISETALHDFIDVTVFLILGALLAAFARQVIPQQEVEDFSRRFPVAAIGAMMGLAVLLCLCSEADAFVAASFVTLRPAAKLAFLVLGPMLDLKLFMMYHRVFRPRLIWTIIICVVLQVLIYSLLVHFVWEEVLPFLRGSPGTVG
jgi:hypothetical protein